MGCDESAEGTTEGVVDEGEAEDHAAGPDDKKKDE